MYDENLVCCRVSTKMLSASIKQMVFRFALKIRLMYLWNMFREKHENSHVYEAAARPRRCACGSCRNTVILGSGFSLTRLMSMRSTYLEATDRTLRRLILYVFFLLK